jgi:CubicO group peptidase (beta-lactamase class C family)
MVIAGVAALAPHLGRAQTLAGDDWEPASPTAHGFAPAALERVLSAGAEVQALRSLLVVRNGALIGERYYARASADELRPINSVTKSVASMLVGQALAQRKFTSLAQTVRELLPEAVAAMPNSAAADVTLTQIMGGRTALAYDYVLQYMALVNAPDPLAHVLALPADADLGSRWNYNDAAVSLLAPMLVRAHGLRLEPLAERDLFTPLGITHYAWQRDRRGAALSYAGLRLRARDVAKLVWTMCDGGRWRGAQVLPAAWVNDSTQTQTPVSWRVAPVAEPGYGQLWFTGRIHGHAVVWGWGYGAQFALWAPALKLVVVTAALAPPPPQLAAQNNDVMALVAKVISLLS